MIVYPVFAVMAVPEVTNRALCHKRGKVDPFMKSACRVPEVADAERILPLGDEKFLHMMQTACMGPTGQESGVLWYLERQSAFYRFSRRLSLPQDHETHFLFSTSSGQLFATLSGLPDAANDIQSAG